MYQERRVKAFAVNEFDLIDWFYRGAARLPQTIYRLVHDQLPPEGSSVLSVYHDWPNRSFFFLVYHPSFPEVQPGEPIPRVPGPLEIRWEKLEIPCNEKV